MSQISISQQDFWLPGVFYKGKELRLGALLKGVLLISVCYLYKRQPVHRNNQSIRFQTLNHDQDQRAV